MPCTDYTSKKFYEAEELADLKIEGLSIIAWMPIPKFNGE